MAVGCGTAAPVEASGGSSSTTTATSDSSSTDTGQASSDTELPDGSGTAGPEVCDCAPGTDLIVVLSDDGELWTYDPISNEFALVGPIACGGFAPYSMAVDREGIAWVLLLDNIPQATVAKGMFKVDIADASGCEAVIYEEGLFGVFGMSFATNGPPDTCERLYVHSYSGSGPFSEGPDAGHLGVLTDDDVLQSVGPIDFDGGELAGSGDGRVYSLTGVDPLKIVELDRDTAQVVDTLPLEGFSKTNASAMAFWGGDFYVFTESGGPECRPCLERMCTDELAACEADPDCAPILECLVTSAGDGPDCQGDIVGPGGPLRDCLFNSCLDQCAVADVVSRVTHVDWDDSDGGGNAITVVHDPAPIRIVGAGSSTCAPVAVP
ncbi:MAG: hypothetical protein AAF799_05880 [Myxococcota bacterium]